MQSFSETLSSFHNDTFRVRPFWQFKQHYCTWCDKNFSSNSALQIHQQKHIEEKIFVYKIMLLSLYHEKQPTWHLKLTIAPQREASWPLNIPWMCGILLLYWVKKCPCLYSQSSFWLESLLKDVRKTAHAFFLILLVSYPFTPRQYVCLIVRCFFFEAVNIWIFSKPCVQFMSLYTF